MVAWAGLKRAVPERKRTRAVKVAWSRAAGVGPLWTPCLPWEVLLGDVISSAVHSFSADHLTGTVHRALARMKPESLGAGPSGVPQEEGQPLGHGVQLARAGTAEEVAPWHEEVLQEALAHTLVQFAYQAQEARAEDPPVLGAGVLLAGPEEHRLWEEGAASDIGCTICRARECA